MAGYVRNDTLNNIANGNVINAADLDGEFDAIVAAFHASTGHVHDGTAANGAPITKIGPTQEFVASSSDFSPKTDNTYDLGSATFEFKDAYIDGTAYVDAIDLNGTAITATGTEINYLSGVTSAIQTQLGNKQPLDAELTALAGLTSAADKVPYFTGSGTAAVADLTSFGRSLIDDVDASAGRTTLGLGTVATQDANNVSITGGSITGITDLAVADGGTGASNASGARTNLGLAIGTDVQAYDPQLADIAGLTPTNDGVIIGDGTNFVVETGNTLRTSLGLAIGTNVQAYDQQLTDIAGLTPTDSNFIVGDGTNFVTESGSTARTSLGLGSIATQDASNVTISGGSITGITDLAVADGGTGASTAANARINLLPSYTGNANKVLSINSGGTDVEWSTPTTGTGDVVGPASAVNNRFAAFDGTTGKLIKDSTYSSASFEPADATILKSAAIGVSVQAYDSNLTSFVNTFTLPTTDGTADQVLKTNGSGTLSFVTPSSGTSITISNDTSTSTNLYPTFVSSTSGTASTLNTGNAKLLYKPSTGELQASAPVASNGIFVNANTIAANYTVDTGFNGLSAGPVTVNGGITVTVASGSVWTVV